MLSIILIIRDVKKKLALAIPTEVQATLVKEMIDTPPIVALKTIKILCM